MPGDRCCTRRAADVTEGIRPHHPDNRRRRAATRPPWGLALFPEGTEAHAGGAALFTRLLIWLLIWPVTCPATNRQPKRTQATTGS